MSPAFKGGRSDQRWMRLIGSMYVKKRLNDQIGAKLYIYINILRLIYIYIDLFKS